MSARHPPTPGTLDRHPPGRHATHPTPRRRPLQRTVCILLECILVTNGFENKKLHFPRGANWIILWNRLVTYTKWMPVSFHFLNYVLVSRVDLCATFGGWLIRPFALRPGETIFAEVNISEREIWVVQALFLFKYFVYSLVCKNGRSMEKPEGYSELRVYYLQRAMVQIRLLVGFP